MNPSYSNSHNYYLEPPIDYESDFAQLRTDPIKTNYIRYKNEICQGEFDDNEGYISNDDRTVSECIMEVEKIPHFIPNFLSEYSTGIEKHDSVVPSEFSTKTKTSRYGRVEIETMRAPHPYCPNTSGVCCFMVLLNLGLLLATLGFVVVLQLREPAIIWYFGICMIIFGLLTMLGSLLYGVIICYENPSKNSENELYGTHHWKKSLESGSYK